MKPLKRLIAALACFSFLLSGGLGVGAPLFLCVEADGQVRVETRFDRCCDGPDASEDAAGETGAGTASVASGGNAPFSRIEAAPSCSDRLIGKDRGHTAPRRTLKTVADHELHPPVLAVAMPLQPDVGRAFFGHAGLASPIPAHAPVQTVVLRC